jgi:hypothetical protein
MSGEGFADLTSEDAQWFDGGDGFCSVCMRCSLRVCKTKCALLFHLEGVTGYMMFPLSS